MIKITAVMLFVFLFSGCNIDRAEQRKAKVENDVIEVKISVNDTFIEPRRTILSSMPEDVVYRVYWKQSGDYTEANSLLITGGSSSVSLNAGVWDFKAEAKGSGGILLASDEMSGRDIKVNPSLAFVLKPLSTGAGNIEITLEWTVDFVKSAKVFINNVETPGAVLNDKQLNLALSEPSGNYVISFHLFDSTDKPVTTVTELVRVLPNLNSKALITLSSGIFNSPPSAPADFKAEYIAGTGSDIKITWTRTCLNETHYVVIVNGTEIEINDFTSGEYIWEGGTRGTIYGINIKAVNSFGSSALNEIPETAEIPENESIITIVFSDPAQPGITFEGLIEVVKDTSLHITATEGFDNYYWMINGETVDSEGHILSFYADPSSPAGVYKLSCFVEYEGRWYSKDIDIYVISQEPPGYYYYKWSINSIRDINDIEGMAVQVSEIQFYTEDGLIADLAPYLVSVTGAGNDATGETVNMLIDGDLNTKWLNSEFITGETGSRLYLGTAEVIFRFSERMNFSGFRWATANDAVARDPSGWELSACNDGETWHPLNYIYDYIASEERHKWQKPEYSENDYWEFDY